MTRQRLCIIGPAANVHVQRWAQALQEREWQVSLISTTPLVAALPPALQHIPRYIIPSATATMGVAERVATLLQGWARVPGLVAALKPDLVHVHSLPTPAAVPFLCTLRRLVVSTWGSDVVQRDRRKARLYPYLLGHADQVTATSQYLATVTASYLRSPRTIQIVPFGVDLEQFSPAASLPADSRIGTLRHLEANYGLDTLIAALPLVLSRYPDLHLLIGGAGSLHQMLKQQAQTLGIGRAVKFLGRIPHADVPDFLRSLSIFAMPSRAEAFGVAALEAQACGVPVVASQVGGLPEVVRDGETGLLVPPENPAALANALIALLDDPQRRAALGLNGRQWVRERYSWRSNVAQMLAVYRQVTS